MSHKWTDAKIKDIYANPVGRDIVSKILLQANLPEFFVTNPIVGNLSLKTLAKLSGGTLSPGFRRSLANLLETGERAGGETSGERGAADEPDTVCESCAATSAADTTGATLSAGAAVDADDKWWTGAVFYQIYPRSFADGDGDGKCDLRGIIGKLDYLKELGIDGIWLSPIYDSPDDDNGYDIRDYRKIDAQYGDMDDFDELLAGVHERGMRLIMDLVVNHTSDEHEWFRSVLNDKDSPYCDYYIIRKNAEDGPPDKPPNNWTSFFSGPAWNYYPGQNLWAMHLFSKKQIDLNWENPSLRKEIHAMIRWWLDKGVDGFRLDVINYISKTDGLPDGDNLIGDMMGYRGIEHYYFGPRLLPYLREMRKEAFAPYRAFTVGETPGIGLNMTKLLTGPGCLDLVFGFDHLENPGKTRFDEYAYDLNFLKKYLIKQTETLTSAALYFENHDNPRMPSKVDPSGAYCPEISRLLALIMLTLPGTPFIFQGQELGEVNADFKGIDEISDVESLGLYEESIAGGMAEDEAFRKVLAGTRDHARRPIDWAKVSGNQVYQCFRTLISIRKERRELINGKTAFIFRNIKNYFCYTRRGESTFIIECNLYRDPMVSRVNGKTRPALLFSTYGGGDGENTDRGGGGDGGNAGELPVDTRLRPYEGRIYEARDFDAGT